MRVYMSGGTRKNREWGIANDKKTAQAYLLTINPDIQFVRSRADVIVHPNHVDQPSTTAYQALKEGGKIIGERKQYTMYFFVVRKRCKLKIINHCSDGPQKHHREKT